MYQVAVIGCGRIASGFDSDPKRKYVATHLGAYRRVASTRVVAVCDQDAQKAEACKNKWGIPRAYADCRELLRGEKLDMISVCTLADSHTQIIREALKYPRIKAIFCEKPVAATSRGIKALLAECRQKGVIVQVDHQRRFDPAHIKLRDIIRDARYGKAQQASFYYTAGISNTGTHMFDLLRFLFGEPVWISAVESKNPSGKPEDPNLDGWMQFASGLTATFQACDVTRYVTFELDCLLEQARFVLKASGFELDFYKAQKSPRFSGYQELLPARSPVKTEYQRNFMVNAVKHLVSCLEHGTRPCSSGEDGLAALQMIEGALRSARQSGRRIALNS